MRAEGALRDEICRIGASLYARGYTVGSAGNISARLDDGYLMTPTDACLGALHPDGLTKLSTSGERLEGPAPSKTFALHRGVYECNAALNGIVHTHSRHLVALTLAGVWRPGDVVPPLTPYYVMKVGHIPLVPYYRPGVRLLPRLPASMPLRYAGCSSNGSVRSCGSRRFPKRLMRSKNSKRPRGCGSLPAGRRNRSTKRRSTNYAQRSAPGGRCVYGRRLRKSIASAIA